MSCRVSKHGRIFKTHLFGYPGYAITDFESIDTIYNGSHKTTSQFYPESFHEVSHHGLDLLNWRRQIKAACDATLTDVCTGLGSQLMGSEGAVAMSHDKEKHIKMVGELLPCICGYVGRCPRLSRSAEIPAHLC